jgi:hypothetical protein
MKSNGDERIAEPMIVCVHPLCFMNLAKGLYRPRVEVLMSISGSRLPSSIKIDSLVV